MYTEREMLFMSVVIQLLEDCNPNLEFLSPAVNLYIDEIFDKLEELYEADEEAYMKIKYFVNTIFDERKEGLH